jgi:hypothetical protein
MEIKFEFTFLFFNDRNLTKVESFNVLVYNSSQISLTTLIDSKFIINITYDI